MANSGMHPWLSVVMPSLSGEKWIDSALRSISAEPCAGVEVILVDGGPTSAARDIAARYMDRMHLRILDHTDLSSWQAKTDFGVEMAGACHVCWLGVDDVWLPGRIAAIRRWLSMASDAPLHLAPSLVIDRHGQGLGSWKCPLPAESRLSAETVIERLLIQNFVGAPAPVFRKDAWLACGGLDIRLWYTADWDMWLKLAALGDVVSHGEVTVGFRVHETSQTAIGSRNVIEFTEQMQTVFNRHRAKLGVHVGDAIDRVARASIGMNAALASAAVGRWRPLPHAIWRVLRLGPSGWHRYQRDSRILERVLPRIRAQLTAGH